MQKLTSFLSIFFILISIPKNSEAKPSGCKINSVSKLESYLSEIYSSIDGKEAGIPFKTFKRGMLGFLNLKAKGIAKKNVLSLVDFEKPSNEKRLWIINLAEKKIVEQSLVAHGRNSGEKFADQFSNAINSNMSSLGFYVTSDTYCGKHGLSLRLNGMDKTNSNAFQRSIVLHGANYVSEDFIKCNGRLGRSHGCPAVPLASTKRIIDLVKDGSVLYISKGNINSSFLDEIVAEKALYN